MIDETMDDRYGVVLLNRNERCLVGFCSKNGTTHVIVCFVFLLISVWGFELVGLFYVDSVVSYLVVAQCMFSEVANQVVNQGKNKTTTVQILAFPVLWDERWHGWCPPLSSVLAPCMPLHFGAPREEPQHW